MHRLRRLSIEEISPGPNERRTTDNEEYQGVLDGTQWTQKKLWPRDEKSLGSPVGRLSPGSTSEVAEPIGGLRAAAAGLGSARAKAPPSGLSASRQSLIPPCLPLSIPSTIVHHNPINNQPIEPINIAFTPHPNSCTTSFQNGNKATPLHRGCGKGVGAL
jgi:hypothetical protein